MERISLFEAKTHLSKLLAHVLKGEEYIITKHNQNIAKLTSCDHVAQAIDSITENRCKWKLSTEEILRFKEEGRR